MFCGVIRTTRVGRVGEHNGAGISVHEGLHMSEVTLPTGLRQKVVMLHRSTKGLRNHLVEGKARAGHPNIITLIH